MAHSQGSQHKATLQQKRTKRWNGRYSNRRICSGKKFFFFFQEKLQMLFLKTEYKNSVMW